MVKNIRSADERKTLLASYEASGLSASTFAAQEGIPRGTFYSWIAKLRVPQPNPPAAKQRSAPVRIARVTRSPVATPQTAPIVLEVSGIRLEVSANSNPTALTMVLDILEARARGRI